MEQLRKFSFKIKNDFRAEKNELKKCSMSSCIKNKNAFNGVVSKISVKTGVK
jgi:hypothetical protein